MHSENPMTREVFDYLAQQAGLDTTDFHMDELYPYVLGMLEGLSSLKEIDVSGSEPDMAFVPAPKMQ